MGFVAVRARRVFGWAMRFMLGPLLAFLVWAAPAAEITLGMGQVGRGTGGWRIVTNMNLAGFMLHTRLVVYAWFMMRAFVVLTLRMLTLGPIRVLWAFGAITVLAFALAAVATLVLAAIIAAAIAKATVAIAATATAPGTFGTLGLTRLAGGSAGERMVGGCQ